MTAAQRCSSVVVPRGPPLTKRFCGCASSPRARRRYDHPPPAYNPLQSLPGPRQLSASRREGLSRTYGPGESLSERRKRRETRQLTTAKNMLEYPATSLSHHARRVHSARLHSAPASLPAGTRHPAAALACR